MKTPVALTIIVIAVGLWWGLRERSHLEEIRDRHSQLVIEAQELGIPTDASTPHHPSRNQKRLREDSGAEIREFADTLVAFAKEMEEGGESETADAESQQKRVVELIQGMLSLNGSELKLLITEMRNRTDIDDGMRSNIIGFSIMMLAQQHPESALALYTGSSDLLDGVEVGDHVLSSALNQWAKDQPLAALEWIKENASKHPELVNDEARLAVIAGAAQSDFGLAFQLAAELKPGALDGDVMNRMARSANTPERQAQFLTALRKQAAATTDKKAGEELLQSGLGSLFSQVTDAGYEKSMTWLESAQLSTVEASRLTQGLNYHTTKADTGKWLDWISSQTDTGGKSEDKTRNLVQEWTRNDYKAAGQWLASTPAGPFKETATMSYLETVAPYDANVAAQWAQTLTAEKQVAALKKIHAVIQSKDKAAAEDFATRHGLAAESE
jgi:hypothetical protein